MIILPILAVCNLVLLVILGIEVLKNRKKKSYAIIYNKYGEVQSVFKINPSYTIIKHKYPNEKDVLTEHSYMMNPKIPSIKHDNINYYFWEFKKPEQISILKDFTPIMDTDLLNTILEMEKIKALNKSGSALEGLFTKRNIIIAIAVIGVLVLVTQGGFI